jgi:hypothetical protein
LRQTVKEAPIPPGVQELRRFRQPGDLIDPPGPPVFVSIDKSSGSPGTPFLILGTNFTVYAAGLFSQPDIVSLKPQVIIMIAPNVLRDAEVIKWNNTEIIATVPDTSGYPAYDAYIWVKTRCGESNSKPFRTDPEMEVAVLPCHEGSKLIMEFIDMICSGWEDHDKDPCTGYAWSDQIQHISTSHSVPLTTGCEGTDEFWQRMELKNGWVVDEVILQDLDTSPASTTTLVDSPVNTIHPLVKIKWKIDASEGFTPINANDPPDCHYAVYVNIRGPKGTSWK